MPRNYSARKRKTNVIILLADDLGWADLGYQGSKDIRSPHIDQLAENGIRFTDGHVSASVCSPSRAGLMTGRYQQRFGHEANSPPSSDGMDLKQVTLADRLKKLGYRTGLIGKWHLGNRDEFYPTQRGSITFTVCGPVQEVISTTPKRMTSQATPKQSKKMANI